MKWKSNPIGKQDYKPIIYIVPFNDVLIEAYKGTRSKHNKKLRQIVHSTSQYGQSFPPPKKKTICAWNGLTFAEAPLLAEFKYKLLN